jgi:hypothetical protein
VGGTKTAEPIKKGGTKTAEFWVSTNVLILLEVVILKFECPICKASATLKGGTSDSQLKRRVAPKLPNLKLLLTS